jgi:hypothetical protein
MLPRVALEIRARLVCFVHQDLGDFKSLSWAETADYGRRRHLPMSACGRVLVNRI